MQKWTYRSLLIGALIVAWYYGHYCGKTNADHWWKEQPPLRHALIVRPQPSPESCNIVVDANSVATIFPNGTYALNQTNAQIRNCQFQWIETRGL